MTINLTEKQIEEIAENLECGMRCFLHLKTGEIKAVPDFNKWMGADEEPWEETNDEIFCKMDEYFEFRGPESYETYQIMVDFAESVGDVPMQDKLMHALNGTHPFRAFKNQIEFSEKYQQKWFYFRMMWYIEWVKKQLDSDLFISC